MSYRESRAALTGAVLWRREVGVPRCARILPDGCTDLIWSSRTGLLVAGSDTTAQLSHLTAGEVLVGLRFPPGAGPAVFGVPAGELTDRRVPLDALWPAATVRAIGADPATAAAVLDRVAHDRLRRAGGPDPRGPVIARYAAAGASVAATAEVVGLSERQLHRTCVDLFGYGPKTLARVLRLRRALALIEAGTPASHAAADAGYADQPHLSRDVRALAGVPLRTLTRTPHNTTAST